VLCQVTTGQTAAKIITAIQARPTAKTIAELAERAPPACRPALTTRSR